jgi:DNA-binding response OmpR family regulator
MLARRLARMTTRSTDDTILWIGHPDEEELAYLSAAGFVVRAGSLHGRVEWPLRPAPLLVLLSVAPGWSRTSRVRELIARARDESVIMALSARRTDAAALLEAGAHDVVAQDVAREELVLRAGRLAELSRQRRLHVSAQRQPTSHK